MRFRLVTALAVTAALLAAGCGGDRSGAAGGTGGGTRLSIATGNTTGVYYVLGGGLAELIDKHLPGHRATAEATGASVCALTPTATGSSLTASRILYSRSTSCALATLA